MNLYIQHIRFFSALFLAACLAACSAKVDGGSLVPSAPNSPPQNKVKGPQLDGLWASDCVDTGFDSKRISMVIKGQSVTRTAEDFTDRLCSSQVKAKTLTGTFTYQKALAKGVYEIEYRFNLRSGVTSIVPENIRLDSRKLWISDFYIGETVEPTLALTFVGAPK